MGMSSRPIDPLQGFRFRVTIGGLAVGGFSNVSGLRGEVGVASYREGIDVATMRKLPGIANFDNINLVRGVTPNGALISWWNQVVNLRAGQRESSDFDVPESFRRTVNIQLLNSALIPIREWDVIEAFPSVLEYDEFDASSDDVVMERMELTHEGFEVKTPRGVASFFAAQVTSSALGIF